MGQDWRFQLVNYAWPLATTRGVDTVFNSVIEQDLHTNADPEHRPTTGQSDIENLWTFDRTQPLHAGGICANPGNNQAIGC